MVLQKIFVSLRILLFIIALASLTSTAAFSNDTLIVEKHGQLSVKGNKIVDKNGDPVALHGMCLYWSQWKGQFYNYNCVQWLRDDWKCTVVRASMAVESGGYLTNPETEKAKIMTVINACIDLGIYVIVDWHDHYAQRHRDQSIAFFEEIASTYNGIPNIIYEIYNEPWGSVSWADSVKPYADSLAKHIRAIDSVNLILVGSPNWSQDVDVAANNPLLYNNIAYTIHFYAATHKQWLRNKATTALNKNAALFVSEFGTTESSGTGVIDSAETNTWMQFLIANKLSWCNWSIADLTETSAALKPGSSANGGWLDSDISISGLLIRRKLREAYESSTTSVGTMSETPQNFVLHQNYPNPFNPSTIISYSLPEEAKVKIEIYNLLGQRVAALVDGVEVAGNHSVTWDAHNFSSGIYFYRIKAEGKKTFEKTQKLVFIR
jgi:endoglucanase